MVYIDGKGMYCHSSAVTVPYDGRPSSLVKTCLLTSYLIGRRLEKKPYGLNSISELFWSMLNFLYVL